MHNLDPMAGTVLVAGCAVWLLAACLMYALRGDR